MDKKELEDLKDQELFELQNSISEVIKQRNLEKGDTDQIIDTVSYTHLTLPTKA